MNFIFLGIFSLSMAQASEFIACEYNFGLKEFATHNVNKAKTIHKEFDNEGIHYVVHIDNTKKFNEVDDYISMENDRGHRMTYALTCRSK